MQFNILTFLNHYYFIFHPHKATLTVKIHAVNLYGIIQNLATFVSHLS